MDSGILGLGAVAWTDAWNAAAPDPGLHLAVDPGRLLELLRGMPVARALMSDLERAAGTGRVVELIVSPDRQIAEVATGSGHYVLTPPARNAVLGALLGQPHTGPAPTAQSAGPGQGGTALAREAAASTRGAPAPVPGILWESPSVARDRVPSESIALPWLGPAAYLEVRRDGGGRDAEPSQQPAVSCATLHLQLPQLGCFDARIRVCGSTVAVSVACAAEDRVTPRLADLERRLAAQGLIPAHVGIEPARSR